MNTTADPRRVTVAMLGARMHYAVPRLLHEAGHLERFFTDSYIGNKRLLYAMLRALPARVAGGEVRRWLGREDARLPPASVTSFEILGLRYAMARRRAATHREMEEVFTTTARRFNAAILRRLPEAAATVWGFNTAALELFETAKRKGALCVLEQTILPRRLESELMADQTRIFSGWQPSLVTGTEASILTEREEREWQLADRIVVGSNFVRDGLLQCGVPTDKIAVIPYGVDVTRFSPAPRDKRSPGPLRVFFVGEVGLRKGAPWLLKALQRLGPDRVEARFAGSIALDPARLAPYADVARFLGPVPRIQMADLFRWADVFALPSIVEGSAAASYEALLSGLPLVVTPNTGTIIRDDEAGLIVPPGDDEAIARALLRYHEEVDLLDRHRAGALALVDMASTQRYGRDLVSFVKNLPGH